MQHEEPTPRAQLIEAGNSKSFVRLLKLIEAEDITKSNICSVVQRIDQGETAQISLYRKHSPDDIIAFITLELIGLSEFYNNGLSVEQIKATIDVIVARYYHLTPEDIRLFCLKAKSCEFGKVYGTLTPPTVIEWLDQYDRRRDEAIEASNYTAHASLKEARHYYQADIDRHFNNICKRI